MEFRNDLLNLFSNRLQSEKLQQTATKKKVISLKKVLKVSLYIIANALFIAVIYFLSLRPLSPNEEQLIINYSNKSFYGFVLECLSFASFFTFFFSSLSFLIYIILFKTDDMKIKPFVITILFYFVISIILGLEYFSYINSLVFNKSLKLE